MSLHLKQPGAGVSPASSTVDVRVILLVLLFLLLANANAVFARNLLQRLHPFTFLFWSFLSCSLFFLGRLALQGWEALAISGKVMVPPLVVNCTTALNWMGYYFALRFVEQLFVVQSSDAE